MSFFGPGGALLQKPALALSQLVVDADKDWTPGAVVPGESLLYNSDFEVGSPPSNWVAAGAGVSFTQSTLSKTGAYSGQIINGAGNEGYCEQHPTPVANYSGNTYTMGAWIYATVPNRACLNLYDNDGSGYLSSQSAFHPGDSQWHWITVTRTNRPGLTDFIARCRVDAGAATTARYDLAMLVKASSLPEPSIASGITTVKQLAAAMAKGDILFFDGTRLVKLTSDSIGKCLTSHDFGVDPNWTYPP